MAQDVFAQAEAIKRRKALLEALQKQSQETPIVGNTGIGQLLAKLGTAYIANKGQGQLETMGAENQQAYQQQLAEQLQNFMKQREGTPGQVLDTEGARQLMENNVNPQLAEPVKGDPRSAVFSAMASRFPEMKAVGAAGLQDLLHKPKADYKEHSMPDGTLVRTYEDGRVVPLGTFAKKEDKWGPPEDMDVGGRKIRVQKNETTGKYHEIGSGQVINVSTGDNKLLTGMVEAVLPGGKSYEPAKAAATGVMLAQETLAAINEGAKTGSLGKTIQAVRKFGELVGVPNASTAPTETVGMLAGQRVLAKANGSLGTGFSNADRDFLAQSQGDLSTNPAALKRILAISIASDIKEIQRHQKRVSGLSTKVDPTVLEGVEINFSANLDPDIDQMVKNILEGRASTFGMTKAPQQAAPGAPGAPAASGVPANIQAIIERNRQGAAPR